MPYIISIMYMHVHATTAVNELQYNLDANTSLVASQPPQLLSLSLLLKLMPRAITLTSGMIIIMSLSNHCIDLHFHKYTFIAAVCISLRISCRVS